MSNRAKRCKYSHSQLQLADLNNDCLCEIFGHLNIDDLDHVSQISESFKSVADIIVPKKFGSWMIEEYQKMRNKAYGPQRILVINRPLLEIVKLPSLFFYQYTKDLHLIELLIKDYEALKLFKEMTHLEAVIIIFCRNLTGACLKPLQNLKSVKFYEWNDFPKKLQTQTEQEFKSFLKRNQSIEELVFGGCPFIMNCSNEIADLPNLNTLDCKNDNQNSLNVKCLEVARMANLRKVIYRSHLEEYGHGDFLNEVIATNVVEELEIYEYEIDSENFLPQQSNIKILSLKSGYAPWDFLKNLQMFNLEKLSVDVDAVKKLPLNFILKLIKNLPKLKKLELHAYFDLWEEPHDEIEKVLRLQNRKLEICLANELRYLIKWPLCKVGTFLQFTFIKFWDFSVDDSDDDED